MARKKILIVEDEKDIQELLKYHLEKEGYEILQVFDGEDGLELAQRELPDLIILDVMLPSLDGMEICRYLRADERTQIIPVIILTAKSEESDVIVGLKLGADDYVTKPFSPKVLVARVHAIFRRSEANGVVVTVRKHSSLVIDITRHKMIYKNQEIDFTPIEFNILEFLSRHPGRVFSRDQIMDGAWKEGKFIVDRAVDVHVQTIRKKLGEGASLIETVRGIGYRFAQR